MLTYEQKQTVEDNINLVYSIAHKFNRPNLFDDMVQEGCLGLIKAVENFNPEFGVKLGTYAYAYIEGYINMFLRRDCVIKPTINGNILNIPNICELTENISVETNYDSIDTSSRNIIFNSISDFQKLVLILTRDGYTQEEIATITGKTQCKISQELQAIRDNPEVISIALKIYSKGELENGKRARNKS